MSVRGNKNKAVKHQWEVVHLLRTIFVPPLEDDDIKPQIMGMSGNDVILTPTAKKLIPFDIECKRHSDKTWKNSCINSLKQTVNNTNIEAGRIPLLVRRKNRSQNRFIMPLNDALKYEDVLKGSNIKLGTIKAVLMYSKNDIMISSDNKYINLTTTKFIEYIAWYKQSKT